jgi:membrane protease YdiL (CAAX protease family)
MDEKMTELNNKPAPDAHNGLSGIKIPGTAQAGLMFSTVLLLFIYIGSRVQQWSFSGGIIITEFGLILVPVMLFSFFSGYDIRRVFRLHRPGLMNLFIVFWIMIFALPVVAILNLGYSWLMFKLVGNFSAPEIPVPGDIGGFLQGILVVGASAGICEEILFRGFIFRGMEKYGAVKAVLLTAFLFGIMHLDFQKLFGTFLLGVLIGFIVYRGNSIFNGMFAHFMNNSLAFALMFGLAKFRTFAGTAPAGETDAVEYFRMIDGMSSLQIIIAVSVWSMILLFFGAGLGALLFAFHKNNEGKAETVTYAVKETGRRQRIRNAAPFFPGILFAGFVYTIHIMTLGGAISKETAGIILGAIGMR